MSEDLERDAVDDALLQMGLFDEREAAIEQAEAEGVLAVIPAMSAAKTDAIVSASLKAAAPEPESEGTAGSSTGPHRWIPWACGVAVAVAAALVLWQATPSSGEVSVRTGPLPSGQLTLGGTARTLGETPTVRAYGPGDAFFAELSFDTPFASDIVAELFARDADGALQPVPLPSQNRDGVTVFEGEIAALLSPGIWTLQVRYGRPHSCSESTPGGCETRESRIQVLGP